MEEKLKKDIEKIDKVYRFLSDAKYNIEGFSQDYLWFSELDRFNDPFELVVKEGDFNFTKLSHQQLKSFLLSNSGITFGDPESPAKSYSISDFSDKQLEKLVVEKFDEVASALNVIVLDIINKKQNNKFHSLAHDANTQPLENRLMWSHYTNGLRGFVIEFYLDPLLASIASKASSSFGGYTLMNYTALNFDNYIKETIDSGKPLYADRMLFSKHLDWSYEEELRLICAEQKNTYDKSCISRVIIGEKMDPNKKRDLIGIIKSKGLLDKTYVTSIDRKDYSINICKFVE
ncbi:DUF2971 domain-containing protein [Vibrio sp. 10N.261.46.E11]|uniref:DUF2971 domain-containing protein n=1 Tax=Vibrio sp. 10N.261.46.E11 TaxID=3229662 RepID=UPI0035511585